MDCTVWNERHRTRLACRRPGAEAYRDIERGKVPSAASSMHREVSMHESRPEQEQIKLFGTQWYHG